MFRRDVVLVLRLLQLAGCVYAVAPELSHDIDISVSMTPTSQIVAAERFWSIWNFRKPTVVSLSRSSTVDDGARVRQPMTEGDTRSSQIQAVDGTPISDLTEQPATVNGTAGDEKIAVPGDKQTGTGEETETVRVEKDIVTAAEKTNRTTSQEDIVSTSEVMITAVNEEIVSSGNSTTVVRTASGQKHGNVFGAHDELSVETDEKKRMRPSRSLRTLLNTRIRHDCGLRDSKNK